jgi:hypothetical protein
MDCEADVNDGRGLDACLRITSAAKYENTNPRRNGVQIAVWESTGVYFAVGGLAVLGAPQLSRFPSREIAFCLALAVPGLGAPATASAHRQACVSDFVDWQTWLIAVRRESEPDQRVWPAGGRSSYQRPAPCPGEQSAAGEGRSNHVQGARFMGQEGCCRRGGRPWLAKAWALPLA